MKKLIAFVCAVVFTACSFISPTRETKASPSVKFPNGSLVCVGSNEFIVHDSRFNRVYGVRMYTVFLVRCKDKCRYIIRENELKKCN